jgi:hypothetical protein
MESFEDVKAEYFKTHTELTPDVAKRLDFNYMKQHPEQRFDNESGSVAQFGTVEQAEAAGWFWVSYIDTWCPPSAMASFRFGDGIREVYD